LKSRFEGTWCSYNVGFSIIKRILGAGGLAEVVESLPYKPEALSSKPSMEGRKGRREGGRKKGREEGRKEGRKNFKIVKYLFRSKKEILINFLSC
jgi:hypothetical protein